MTREVTVNPRFGKRSWVKLWVNEWLDGTTRFEMSDAQRAFWIDLLAMAGRSRFPGIICAGQIDGKFVGYPITKFQSLMAKPINVEETFKLFERSGKIIAEITTETPTKLYKLTLCNWGKFQSEYQRQKPYRLQAKLQESYPESYNASNNTEVEVEVEGDREEEKSKSIRQQTTLTDFDIFWEAYPRKVNKPEARKAFIKGSINGHLGDILAGLESWKKCEQWENEQFIPHPARFLNQKQWSNRPAAPTKPRGEKDHDYSATLK